jgi:hypothetical protein
MCDETLEVTKRLPSRKLDVRGPAHGEDELPFGAGMILDGILEQHPGFGPRRRGTAGAGAARAMADSRLPRARR